MPSNPLYVDVNFRVNQACKVELEFDEEIAKGYHRTYVYKLSQGALETIASHLNRRAYSQNSLSPRTETSQSNHFKIIYSQSVRL